MLHIVDVPRYFAEDHMITRDLPSGELLKQGPRLWRFACTIDDLKEWLSDADYYWDCASEGWSNPDLGLQSSARSTHRRVKALLESIS